MLLVGFDIFTGIYPYLLTIKNNASLFKVKLSVENDNDEPVPLKKRRLENKPINEISIDLSDKK